MEFKCCPPAHVHVIAGSKNHDQDKNLIVSCSLEPNITTPMFTHIYIYLDFILFVCSWNNYSLPQLRLYQCAVYVEGSSAVALDPA